MSNAAVTCPLLQSRSNRKRATMRSRKCAPSLRSRSRTSLPCVAVRCSLLWSRSNTPQVFRKPRCSTERSANRATKAFLASDRDSKRADVHAVSRRLAPNFSPRFGGSECARFRQFLRQRARVLPYVVLRTYILPFHRFAHNLGKTYRNWAKLGSSRSPRSPLRAHVHRFPTVRCSRTLYLETIRGYQRCPCITTCMQ